MRNWIFCLGLLKLVAGQDFTTDSNQVTVTYNPGIDCLPYDGSVVPDCRKYVDPITKQPYFKEHSANCSRFWMCGPEGETCLVECAHCGGPSNSLCNDQWALTFDPSYQYPLGPVCDWPSNIECGVVCDTDLPEYECCTNDDCGLCPDSYCSMEFVCVNPPACDCQVNSECENYDGVCNVPAPHDPESCAYCSPDSECLGGCIDNDNCPSSHPTCTDHVCGCGANSECDKFDGICDMTADDPYTDNCYYCDSAAQQCKPGCGGSGEDNNYNCPSGYECDLTSHQCVVGICEADPDCEGYDQVCNEAHDNCFFCGNNCDSVDGCCPGCHDSDLNCAYPTPVCDLDSNLCGCNTDDDCNAGDYCNNDNNQCEEKCDEDSDCDGYDAVCNENYDNCFYCGDCEGLGCCPGCAADANCVYPTPICQGDHKCGCNTNDDCNAGDYCNTDNNQCEALCVDDTECAGFDAVCNENYDNCFYCGDCEGFGCCPGCSTDSNCVYPAPICQDDHKCGCNTNDDCEVGDQCNTDSNICEAIPNECETDLDCNDPANGISGECDPAVAVQTQCYFCESNGLYNVCKPGCKYDHNNDDNIPMCPVEEPVCDVDTHFCNAQSGATLLTQIVFTSSGCDGCSTEGVNMTLTGSENLITPPQCQTVNLDHPSTNDYVAKGTFDAVPAQQNDGWDSCYRRGLEGEVTASVVTWTGEGTWSPVKVCYDWDKPANLVSVCQFPSGTTLQKGESATLSCQRGTTTTCD